MKKKFYFASALTALGCGLLAIAPASAVTISPYIPGMPQSSNGTSPGSFISGFYSFALLIGGILAFGAMIYGGVKNAISGGNPTMQSDGKKWIWSALLGLLLLGGAWIILNTVNPTLVNLNLPALAPIQSQTAPQP